MGIENHFETSNKNIKTNKTLSIAYKKGPQLHMIYTAVVVLSTLLVLQNVGL